MASEDNSPIKKERDPILTIGFVVLILAFATVGGIFINDNYLRSENISPAMTGDKVNVNYTGSYYGFYTEDGAAVFDTSIWSIANDSAFLKSFEFALRGSESSYVPISFTIGGTDSYLKTFMAAAYGLRPGDSSQVCIAPADGYGALTADNITVVNAAAITIPRVQVMSYSDFKSIYNGGNDITSNVLIECGPYGWPLSVKYNPNSSSNVTVEHIVTDGAEYRMNKDVNVEVRLTNSSATIELTYIINGGAGLSGVPFSANTSDGSDPTVFIDPSTGIHYENVKLVQVFYKDKNYYITAVDDITSPTGPTVYVLKNTSERVGMYLYFNITRV